MKYRFSAWYIKALAYVLAAITLFLGFWSGVLVVYNLSIDTYSPGSNYMTSTQCVQVAQSQGLNIINKFRDDPDYDKWDAYLEGTNLRFIILDERTGEVEASYTKGLGIKVPENLKDNRYLREYNWKFELGEKGTFLEDIYVTDYYFGEKWAGSNSWSEISGYGTSSYGYAEAEPIPVDEAQEEAPMEEAAEQEQSWQILYLLPKTLDNSGDRLYEGYRIYRFVERWNGAAPWIFGICVVLFLACAIFLCIQAGRRPGRDELVRSWLDRIPLDLVLAADIGFFLGVCGCIAMMIDPMGNPYMTAWEFDLLHRLSSLGVAACGIGLLGSLASFVSRCKYGKWWRTLLVWKIWNWLWSWIKKPFCWFGGICLEGFRSMPLIPRAVLTILAAGILDVLLLYWAVETYSPVIPTALLVLYNGFLFLALLWGLGQLRLLQKAARGMASGELDQPLDTSRMYWEFKEHGENLKAIAGGMTKAVEKQMKSERLKTELITNVSHDIKTPLTSIVNYVDLLQKPHTEAEGIQYLEVLDRQAKRLKKLTENLVEASKASTGNMAVTLEPTSVMELINQAVEEYRDRLEAGKLEVVVSQRGDLSVLADGKLMWRILDNLLNNVIKYALPGTRVYVTAQKWENRVVIAVKNISRDPLNVDADELMERFVRGDSSRHTEGTGLGLNIARSLTQLQNGEFTLTVDGDFFKAEVSLPVA